MKKTLRINIRISTDATGKPRFTKDEVQQLIKDEKVSFHRDLLCRIGDGKVIGQIEDYQEVESKQEHIDMMRHNSLIFALQRIAFSSKSTEGNSLAERFKKIALSELECNGITQPKTFCKICWNEIENKEQNIIYFCDDCEKECGPYNKLKNK